MAVKQSVPLYGTTDVRRKERRVIAVLLINKMNCEKSHSKKVVSYVGPTHQYIALEGPKKVR